MSLGILTEAGNIFKVSQIFFLKKTGEKGHTKQTEIWCVLGLTFSYYFSVGF